MLRAPLNLGVDAHIRELTAQPPDRFVHIVFARAPRFCNAFDDLAIALGIEITQTLVFDLPLDLPNPETVRDRRIDVEGFTRDRGALGRRQACQRPHIMQPVRKFDDDDANVARHGHKHLAQVLDLRIFL